MAQKRGAALSKTSAFQDVYIYVNICMIFDAIVHCSAKLTLCLLDLIFYVFLNVVDLSSK